MLRAFGFLPLLSERRYQERLMCCNYICTLFSLSQWPFSSILFFFPETYPYFHSPYLEQFYRKCVYTLSYTFSSRRVVCTVSRAIYQNDWCTSHAVNPLRRKEALPGRGHWIKAAAEASVCGKERKPRGTAGTKKTLSDAPRTKRRPTEWHHRPVCRSPPWRRSRCPGRIREATLS